MSAPFFERFLTDYSGVLFKYNNNPVVQRIMMNNDDCKSEDWRVSD
jgi:hypothetical protein